MFCYLFYIDNTILACPFTWCSLFTFKYFLPSQTEQPKKREPEKPKEKPKEPEAAKPEAEPKDEAGTYIYLFSQFVAVMFISYIC